MASDPQTAHRSIGSLLIEAVVLIGASILALVWFIPAQTSEGGFGLSPAFLPKLCVAAIGLLSAADACLRFVRRAPQPRYAEGWGAFLRVAVAACLGTLALYFGGTVLAMNALRLGAVAQGPPADARSVQRSHQLALAFHVSRLDGRNGEGS